MLLDLTRCRTGDVKSEPPAVEPSGDGPEVGFCWRITRCIVPHSEKTCFTPSYVGNKANNTLSHLSIFGDYYSWILIMP